jgi:hypothetical protein
MAITARVYIWYPENENIGHASMHIGAHTARNTTDWYVSWWPRGAAGPFDIKNAKPNTLAQDESPQCEDGASHVRYDIEALNVTGMKAMWDSIRDKPQAHYRLLPKNCSTVVARVLKAGGANELISTWKAIAYGHNVYWTPKDVAQLCDKLKDAGHATKHKTSGCPTKMENKLYVAMGLR